MDKPNLPKTSKMANDQAKELKEAHKVKILEALSKYPDGLIYDAIAVKTGLDKHAVGRRLGELLLEQKIYKPGATRNTTTGRKAYIYKATEVVDYSRKLTQKTLF